MCISNGYRWNVPVVTYGFDQSFLDYFGSNGVAAVQSAIQILNDLPPASSIVLTNYPFVTSRYNPTAINQSLFDLKSETLSLLLEQMGLANPVQNIYVMRQWNPSFDGISFLDEDNWPAGTIPTYIVERNYDPLTLSASPWVDGAIYSAAIRVESNQNYMEPFALNPEVPALTSVAGFNLGAGQFYTGLTYDDVGGLAYLLSTNNINYETLLSGVAGVGTNAGSFVNGAWRPGVDKITFIAQPVNAQTGAFLPTTNYFTDSYLTNGVVQQQQMARIISQPDFIFNAGDTGTGSAQISFFSRTGTTNWLNNAAGNGNTNGAGPGVIQPRVQIVFNKLGRAFQGNSDEQVDDVSKFYGSFDGTTNSPITYPVSQAATNQLTVRMWLGTGTSQNLSTSRFDWHATSAAGAQFALQTSTNLTQWTNLFTVTNDGSVCTYLNFYHTSPSRFYRLVPQ